MQLSDILMSINIFLIAVTFFVILLDNSKPPEVTFSWLLIILVFQFLGILLYILTGINYKARKVVPHLPEETFNKELSDIISEQKEFYAGLNQGNRETNDMVKAMSLLLNCSNSIVTFNNSVKIYVSGKELYNSLINDLKSATHSVHMEYFIWKSDELGKRIKDVLIERSQAGVKIRLLFDGVGSFNRISLKYKRELKRHGIEFKYFLDPLAPLKIFKFNYCNHRKIVVIDGHIGYTGGVNVGDEYISGGKHFDYWRDTHLKLRGDSVRMLQALFLTDWLNSAKELILQSEYFPISKQKKGIPVQIAVSGPDSKWSSIHQLYFSMISNANSKIYIQSPYFIPDTAITKALETAALSGADVHLMITGNPDKKMPFWAAQTYFRPLISAGVKIYLYQKGFLHSKMIVVDDLISTVGSCNMDIRSFHINYEVNSVLYDKEVSSGLKKQFFNDVEDSILLKKDYFTSKNFLYRLRGSICRLGAPLM